MDPTTGTIIVAVIGAVGTITVALINNRPKDGSSGRRLDPMWRTIAAIVVIAAAIWLGAGVVVGALVNNAYSITGLVVAGAVLAVGIVLLRRPKPPQSN